MGNRGQRKQKAVVEEVKSLEERVSGKQSHSFFASRLLDLYGEFMRQDWKRKLTLKKVGPTAYAKGRAHWINEVPLRAAIRVASHPRFEEFEQDLIAVYVNKVEDPTLRKRCEEFRELLDQDLDKRPFISELREEEAKDALDSLIPVQTCARYLGVHRSTLYRWIENGLGNHLHNGSKSVQTFVNRREPKVYVNFLAALEWKVNHHNPKMSRQSAA